MFGAILAGAVGGTILSSIFSPHNKRPTPEKEIQMPVYDERAAKVRAAKKAQSRHGRASTILSRDM